MKDKKPWYEPITERERERERERFKVNKGVRQGCILSTFLFNIYGEQIMRTAGLEDRVLQRLRGVRGQDDATETGRRATPQTIVDIIRNRTLK